MRPLDGNLNWRSFQTPGATASAGASVQYGLSSAGGKLGFFQRRSAADTSARKVFEDV
jgi:hypothetical protein